MSSLPPDQLSNHVAIALGFEEWVAVSLESGEDVIEQQPVTFEEEEDISLGGTEEELAAVLRKSIAAVKKKRPTATHFHVLAECATTIGGQQMWKAAAEMLGDARVIVTPSALINPLLVGKALQMAQNKEIPTSVAMAKVFAQCRARDLAKTTPKSSSA